MEEGPGKSECSPLAGGGCEAHGPAAALDDLLDDAETHAAAFYFVARLEGAEQLEDLVVILGRDTGAVVGNGER